MMSRFTRRHSRMFALLLLVIQLPGARVHARQDACGGRASVYHGPARSFKALARAIGEKVTGVKRERPAPRSLGASKNRTSSLTVSGLTGGVGLLALAVLAPSYSRLSVSAHRPHPEAARPLPSDLSPSPPLHTRK